MIDLATVSVLDPKVLDQPGAFAWWYLDLVDESGDGIVLIWSYGLPFLPGLAGAARAGRQEAPRRRPSLTLSAYQGGKPTFYLLQELDPGAASWEPESGTWRFGETHISRSWSGNAQGEGRVKLDVRLDCAVPASAHRLRGSIRVVGQACQGGGQPPAGAPHVWSPVTVAAEGTVSLECGSWSFARSGRAYHDRNWGSRPLHELGIGRWSWGRLAFSEGELIWYQLEPDAPGSLPRRMVIEVDRAGVVRSSEAEVEEVGGRRGSPFGLAWPRGLRFADQAGEPVEVELVHKVDDGPFYQRFLVRGRRGEEEAWGVAETVVPDRVDQAWMRPLVRMRVHRPGGNNSMWLPLFSGPRAGRVQRLLTHPLWATDRPAGAL